MVFYCLDTESDKWNLEYAIHQRKTYSYQILKPKLFTIVKFSDECKELDFHVYKTANMLQLLLNYLTDEFFEYKKTLRIYCHNLDFDSKFLISILTHNHFTLKPIRKNRLLSLRAFSSLEIKGKIKKLYYFDFRDSYALLPLSIKELGKTIGLNKLDFDLDSDVNESMIEYCKRDNEIIAYSLKELINLFKRFGYTTTIADLPLTIPSLSLKLFLEQNKNLKIKKELKSGKIITKNKIFDVSPQLNAYFRKYYFGGKTDCYNFNIAYNVNYNDVNSLYPFIAKNTKMPIPPYLKIQSNDESDINEFTFALLCIIDESKELYPLIPERDENGSVFYSASKHKIHLLQIEEYYYLKSRNCIKKILNIWFCDEFLPLFEYFDNIYQIRLELQKSENKTEKFCKLPCNAVIGKFAQDIDLDEREIKPICEISTTKLFELMLSNKIQNVSAETKSYEFVQFKEKNFQIDNINVAIAMRILALARLEITKKQHLLQEKNIVFYYTDTDSLVSEPNTILNFGKAIGQIKIEKEFKRFLCLSPKEYLYDELEESLFTMNIFQEKNKIKGLKPDSDFNQYFHDGLTTIRPSKIFECWKRDIPMNSAITVTKRKKTFYRKRLILSDYTTKPLHNIKHAKIIEHRNRYLLLKQIKNWNAFCKKHRQ